MVVLKDETRSRIERARLQGRIRVRNVQLVATKGRGHPLDISWGLEFILWTTGESLFHLDVPSPNALSSVVNEPRLKKHKPPSLLGWLDSSECDVVLSTTLFPREN